MSETWPKITPLPDGGTRVEYESGDVFYANADGKSHRTDGPAIEWVSGTREWRLNGQPHRTDGPAVEWANGDKEWYLNGKRRREDETEGTRRVYDTHAEALLAILGSIERGTA